MAFSAPDDLTIGVAPQEQVTERRFPPDKAGHLRVGLVVEQAVQRMIHGLLTAVGGGFIHAHRKAGDGFRDHANAGVHRGHLHGVLGIHRLAGSGRAEEERRRRGYCVAGLVPGTEEIEKRVFHNDLPKWASKKRLMI